jgi:hypothetical protein
VRLFEHDGDIDHVYVMSNQVSLRRFAGWNDDQVASVSAVVADFFLFYPD